MSEHFFPLGSASVPGVEVNVTAEVAGWEYCSMRVFNLEPGTSRSLLASEEEFIAIPLSGSFSVEVENEVYELQGRTNVFTGPSDVLYLPRGLNFTIFSAGGGRIALPGARAQETLPVQYMPASDTPVAHRGAGNMSRRAHEYCNTGGVSSSRMIVMEVYTPAGNWSSYPPHKHDVNNENESQLEEIYYYEVAEGPQGAGFGYQRAYSADERPLDLLEEVRSGDVVVVPYGWHGPAIAHPLHDLYYLNVMAGGGKERVWKFTDEPGSEWVRESWEGMELDPRLTSDAG